MMPDADEMQFLNSLVTTVKPELVAAAGLSPAGIAVVEEAQRANGCGRIVELKGTERAAGKFDMFLCAPGQEQRLRESLAQISPHGVIVMHDREAALAMEREGLLSVVTLPTARALVLAQKRPQRG
jgi:hypothetical protein